MGDVVLFGGGEGAGDEFVVSGGEIEAAGDVEEGLFGFVFEVFPEFVGAAEEGDVVGVFVVGEADEAGLAVGGAEGVGDVELFEAEDGEFTFGEVEGGGGAHGAEAEDDRVVVAGHERGLWGWRGERSMEKEGNL